MDNIQPQEDPQKVNNMLIAYYEEIHEVLQKRLDECQDIIEEYMTHLIENKKKELHSKMESYTMGESVDFNPNSFSNATKNEITQITEDHSQKLKMLREQYDEFLKGAENEFFAVLKMIKIQPNASKESEYNHKESESSQLNPEFSQSFSEKSQSQYHSERPQHQLQTSQYSQNNAKSQLPPSQSNYYSQHSHNGPTNYYNNSQISHSSSRKFHSQQPKSHSDNIPEYESGELAKVAREFLAQQDKNLASPKESDQNLNEKNHLSPSDSNSRFTFSGEKDGLNTGNKDRIIKVNDLLNHEYVRQGVSVFDFNYRPEEKENESEISFGSQAEFVDYNQEAKNIDYKRLSESKKSEEHRSPSSYYGSTKKHLKYATDQDNHY